MKRRNIFIILGVLFVLIVISILVLLKQNNHEDSQPTEIVNLDVIEGYNYVLEDRDTKLLKDTFELLSEELKKNEIDYEVYAKLLAKLYIIDLYTISNKLNQYDVGGSEYVHPDAKENFELKVKDTIYKYVEDNSYGKREQELPLVSTIEVIEVKESEFSIDGNKVDGYSVNVSWTYEKDLGYDAEAIVNLVKIENKLYVISQSVSE